MLLFVILFLVLSIPAVQTKMGNYATNRINKEFKTNINIAKVGLQLNGDIELKDILIKDYKKDTLISIGELNSSIISFKNLYYGKLNFGDIDIQNLKFNLKTYKGKTDTNLDIFVARFDDDNPHVGPSEFLFSSSDLSLENGIFTLTDENLDTPQLFKFVNLNANTTDFLINGPEVSTRINTFSFLDTRGVKVENLKTNFKYTLDHMSFDDLNIKTTASELIGNLRFNYKREDLKDFEDKVSLTARFRNSKVSLTELNVFFNEFGTNQIAKIDTDLSGTLNNLKASNLKVSTTRNTEIDGDITFKNLLSNKKDSFSLKGSFKNLASNYEDLVALLPSLLGSAMPSLLAEVGNFKIKGTSYITAKEIDSNLEIATDLGLIKSDLILTDLDNIDNASYKGTIVLNQFDIGKLVNDTLVKNTSLDIDVHGKGFTLDNLKTTIKGDVFSLNYNAYNYKNITVAGTLGNKIFNGGIKADDPNFKLEFIGLADMSEVTKKFDFKANVDYINLNALNFVSRDRISEFRGLVTLKAEGSSYNNAIGKINVKNTSYKNQDNNYTFQDFAIESSFKNQERFITINSPDIIEGSVSGKFKIEDIIKLTENSVGSIYTNYLPHTITEKQYLKFKFNIYSKIATVFFKDLTLSKNTFIEGKIETDEKGFEFNLNAPTLKFKDYFANKINVSINNSNPLYNTFVEIDSLSTGFYNASDFSLINVTKRDTLFIKSEFKGGKQNSDNFNLNLFYTIDNKNKSVVGFRKSDLRFKSFDWFINSKKDTLNKVRFDRNFKNFDITTVAINQGREEILLSGLLNGTSSKDLKVNFKNVQLQKITPRIDSLDLKGIVNGALNIAQTNGVYLPKSNIDIKDLNINNYKVGDLKAKLEGNNSITNYNLEVSLLNKNIKSLEGKGSIDVSDNNPFINLDVRLQSFLLDPISPLGEGIISNIRGLVSGKAKVFGSLNKPNIDGELYLDKAGLSIPYLNIDYGFGIDSKVLLKKQEFIFDNITLTDTKYASKGKLSGFISHNNFSDWQLGLQLNTDRLLVLNTEESLDELYYGTAFVSGKADIKGPTDQLIIDVDGRTAKGTQFFIPLNDIESFGDNSFMHFLTPQEKEARLRGDVNEAIKVKGLTLDFDLDVNQNATIEIVIDKEAGSTIKGRGEGNLNFLINTNGIFKMWGDFAVFDGIYKFKYGEIVEKKFEVEKGGNIVWDGEPMQAQINLKALYKTTANPSLLLDTPISQRVPVVVEIELTGQLEQPEPNFNLEFPNVTSTLKSELDYRLSAKDEMDFQALTLLGTGGFSNGARGFDFTGTISERLSGIVNNILGGDNENLSVGIDFELGQDTPDLQTNNRVGLTLQTKINEKILVNGKLGVPFGNASQTVISGDVQIDLLLNDDGTLRAKVFNRENTIRNFGEEIGFTQGVGLSYNVEFDSFKEFLQIIFSGKNKKTKALKKADDNLQNTTNENLPTYTKMKTLKDKS